MTDQTTPEAWSPRGDRMLALLPAEHPPSFDALPFEEQKWRGRAYLIAYVTTGSSVYSWWSALRENDPEVKAWAANANEEELAFRVSEAAQGRWYGDPEGLLPEQPGNPPPA